MSNFIRVWLDKPLNYSDQVSAVDVLINADRVTAIIDGDNKKTVITDAGRFTVIDKYNTVKFLTDSKRVENLEKFFNTIEVMRLDGCFTKEQSVLIGAMAAEVKCER